MMPSFSPFDAYGHVSRNIDPAIVEAMPDDQRAALMACLSACREAEDCEANVSTLRIAVNKSMHKHDAALLAVDASMPKLTHQQALQATIAANDPAHYDKPKKPHVNPKPKANLAEALAELAEIRAELQKAIADLKILSRTRGESIGRFMKTQPPITFETVARAHIAAGDAQRVGIANGSILAPAAPEVARWPIETARAVKAKSTPRYYGKTAAVRR